MDTAERARLLAVERRRRYREAHAQQIQDARKSYRERKPEVERARKARYRARLKQQKSGGSGD